jgi:hypothetical protein
MVIFSIDMCHEVLPIISGTRLVFKKPLFVNEQALGYEKEIISDDQLCDGGSDFLNSYGGGDY